jgi:hypothetical protein
MKLDSIVFMKHKTLSIIEKKTNLKHLLKEAFLNV